MLSPPVPASWLVDALEDLDLGDASFIKDAGVAGDGFPGMAVCTGVDALFCGWM